MKNFDVILNLMFIGIALIFTFFICIVSAIIVKEFGIW